MSSLSQGIASLISGPLTMKREKIAAANLVVEELALIKTPLREIPS
jgi:hypothetical protein